MPDDDPRPRSAPKPSTQPGQPGPQRRPEGKTPSATGGGATPPEPALPSPLADAAISPASTLPQGADATEAPIDVEDAGGSGSGGGGPPPAPPVPGPRQPERRRRFVISQLLAQHRDRRTRSDMVDLFAMRLSRSILPNADLVSDVAGGGAVSRRVLVVDADPEELAAKRQDLTTDAVIEPEKPRVPAALGAALRFAPPVPVPVADGAAAGPGVGGSVSLLLRGPEGEPVQGAVVVATLLKRGSASETCAAGSRADAGGRVEIPFDPDIWMPVAAAVTPENGYWGTSVRSPQGGQTVQLLRLPRRGPFGWWQLLSGMPSYDISAGEGLVVGVVDTGVGPHPYLDHVLPVGAFLDGRFMPGVEEGRDASDHGTHVSGLIAARPAPGSGDYGGMSPGAEVRMARVFAPDRLANQGDIALAVSSLASTYNADLINLSLAGEASEIEQDAIIVARREGSLCVAAAGNGGGGPVSAPASYPECAAVSALGLLGSFPPDVDASASLPGTLDRFGVGGLYLAAFSNAGPDLACAAAGAAVISTVPGSLPGSPAYAEMSGTSMAAPLAVGALAALLSRDANYRAMPRSAARADYAAAALASRAMAVGLARVFAGAGLARAR